MEIQNNLLIYQVSNIKNAKSIFTEMNNLRDLYRALWRQFQEEPTEQNKKTLIEHLYSMKSFLIDHQEEIYQEAAANGFPPGTNLFLRDPAVCLSKALCAIETFQGPQNPAGSLYYLNEQFTQLVYLCAHT